ncbi:MAG TPA: DUF1385 domain-containing protein [Terriglobales bacterium]|jgi:uncharacterized protein YqhQ|nr:DUF1385 domain-containing protein [Terriglobales bacterium]
MLKYLSTLVRFFMTLQLLPALESGEETLVGGQAVMEGVMMRTPHAWGIAVRNPSGEVVVHREPLDRLSEKHKWVGWPLVRGIATLGQAMSLGFRALKFSANVALDLPAEEGEQPGKKLEISGWMAAVNGLFSLAFFIFMYKFVPLVAATELKRHFAVFSGQIAFNLVDGVIRIALFLFFIWGISRFKDIHRVFEYHGSEHKTVFAFEDGKDLTSGNVQQYSTYHPRCGTSFLMTVMLISIAVYTVIPVTTFWARFGIRIALLPVIAALSYEMIRFAGKLQRRAAGGGLRHAGSALFLLLTRPGMWLQRITTQPPADAQVECAIRALNEAMELEKTRGGELVIA